MGKLKYIIIAVVVVAGISVGAMRMMDSSPSAASGYLTVDQNAGPTISTQELVANVAPAVVSITTELVGYNSQLQAVPEIGAGSGIIISPDGYIVTNDHVVAGAQNVTVTLSNGANLAATIVGTDVQTDLAVVKIVANNLSYLHFLDSSLQQLDVLEPVIAVGNALALPGGPTWTTGVVSNLGRSIQEPNGVVLNDVIQTDAPINPGNSGGPLLNQSGQVVGINVAVATNADEICFAISTDTVIPTVQRLIEG